MMPLAMVCLFMACKKESKTAHVAAVENLTTVKYNIEISRPKTVIQPPVNGRSNWMFSEEIEGNKEEVLKFSVSEPGYWAVWNTNYTKLFVEPGESYEIEEVGEEVSIKGANEHGQRFLQTFRGNGKYDLINKYAVPEFTLKETIEKINLFYDGKVEALDSLKQAKLVTDSFYSFVKKDIATLKIFTQAEVLSNVYYRTTYSEKHPEYLKAMPSEAAKLWESIFEKHKVSNAQLMISNSWLDYAQNYVFTYHALFKQGKAFDFSKDSIYSERINFAKTVLSGETLEYFTASYIYYCCKQRGFNKGLITVFEAFKRDYPESSYSQYLEKEIDIIRDYQQKIAAEFGKKVKLKSSKGLKKLNDIIAQYKGENLYIDVWSTGCGPCKDEFQFGKELKQYLKQQNVKMVYISIDEDSNEKAWKNMIKYYELNGDHFRCNKELKEDLFKEYSDKGYISIPWYIIVNKKGEIVKRHAKRPSEKDSLYLQLEETLQLN